MFVRTASWTCTYLAMHLYPGNCSSWRECFSRPGTEWNATRQKSHRDYDQYFVWCSGKNMTDLERDCFEDTADRRKLPVLAEVGVNWSFCARSDFLSSRAWQTLSLLLLLPFQADWAGAGKSRLEIPENRIVQCSTPWSAQTWVNSARSCPRQSTREWKFGGGGVTVMTYATWT